MSPYPSRSDTDRTIGLEEQVPFCGVPQMPLYPARGHCPQGGTAAPFLEAVCMGPQRPSPSDIPHETDVLVPFEIQNIPSEPRLRCHPSLRNGNPSLFS